MAENRLKIVVVGGGSVAWTPNIVRDILLTPALCDSHFVLLDTDTRASDLTSTFLKKLANELGANATFTSTNRRTAIQDAQYIIITISTGGLDAMAHDLTIPERFGIFHTVGDTSGPGGWARLIRNFDVFVSLAKDINRYARGAVVLNYTNPMSTLTDVLARLCRGPVVGLCHGLFENLALLRKLYECKGESELSVQYGGLNHFFWITEARAGRTDILADLTRRLQKHSFTDLLRFVHRDAMGFTSNRELATELFRLTGVMPYLGDRHTCEFFNAYITNPATMRKYKLVRTTIAERRAQREASRKYLMKMIRGSIEPGYRKRTRETAADIIEAHSQGKVFIDVGNVPNRGQISNLPAGLVVETAVRVDRNGFTPLAFGALPRLVQGFIEPYAHVFPMVVDACFRKDKKLALQALRLDPVCAHLNGRQVVDLGERLLGAHRKFITAF
jgi:alpha-galactosidase